MKLKMHRADTHTLARAMEVLARDIQSGDGVANAAIAEAGKRLLELKSANDRMAAALATAARSFRHESVEWEDAALDCEKAIAYDGPPPPPEKPRNYEHET